MRPLLVIGTRPEAIKMAPILAECRRRTEIDPWVCLTGQHREMLRGILDYLNIQGHDYLEVLRDGQTLADLTARLIDGLDGVCQRRRPDCVVVQGDTASVLAGSIVAFYRRLPLVHVEAGLRSGRIDDPWPEEFNRRVAGLAATLHCAPTRLAAANLLSAGVPPKAVHITGNTVVDSLLQTLVRERERNDFWSARHPWYGRRMVLVTCHRRDNLELGLKEICRAVAALATQFPAVAFVWPVHRNPQVSVVVQRLLAGWANIHLLEPAPYPEFVWLMDQATLILTDSGGVQEEAPSLKKPVLVLRATTERPEAIEVGAAELIGAHSPAIVARVGQLLTDSAALDRLRPTHNPFGDGQASRRIVDLMLAHVGSTARPLAA